MSNRKCILFVVNVDWFFISHRLAIAEEAIKNGYKVIVAGKDSGRKKEIIEKGVEFIDINISRSGTNPLRELTLFFSIIKLYRIIKPDIVHHITLKPVIYGSVAARLLKMPRVINAISGMGYNFTNERLSLISSLMILFMKFGFKGKSVHFIFQNNDDYNELSQKNVFSRQSEIFFIKGSGVDLTLFNPVFFPSFDIIKILFPSRMLWDKGVKELYYASQQLKSLYKHKIEFILVGAADFENKAGVNKEFMQNWQDGKYVKWFGYQKEMVPFFADSHIVVLPSYREGLPKSLIEACAAGRAIITTDTVGCRECVEDGKNGILVPVKNAESLAQSIIYLIENFSKMIEMGCHGRLKAEEEFDIKLVVNKHMFIYEKLL